jgi:hypothetical protein
MNGNSGDHLSRQNLGGRADGGYVEDAPMLDAEIDDALPPRMSSTPPLLRAGAPMDAFQMPQQSQLQAPMQPFQMLLRCQQHAELPLPMQNFQMTLHPQQQLGAGWFQANDTWRNPSATPIGMTAGYNVQTNLPKNRPGYAPSGFNPVNVPSAPVHQMHNVGQPEVKAEDMDDNGEEPGQRKKGKDRQPRVRMPIPKSGPHPRVPANHVFPTQPERIGKGVRSGCNWLVVVDGSEEPVLRVPLMIERSKCDTSESNSYPGSNTVIPAGTSLRTICQEYPRHVWGEMLRIFMSESWDGRDIWNLLPLNFRNNALNRPWNYIQAATGREADRMTWETTGRQRVKEPKPKQRSSSAETDETDPEDVRTPLNLDSYDQLNEWNQYWRDRVIEAERRIHWGQNRDDSDEAIEQAYARRLQRHFQDIWQEYENRFGNCDSDNPITLLRVLYVRRGDTGQRLHETTWDYEARCDWWAYWLYVEHVGRMARHAEHQANWVEAGMPQIIEAAEGDQGEDDAEAEQE